MTVSAKALPELQNMIHAKLGAKPFSNPKILAAGAAVLLVLFMLFHSSGPASGDLEKAFRVALTDQVEDMVGLTRAFGGSKMADEAVAEVRNAKVSANIIEKHKLENGDWDVNATVTMTDSKGRAKKDTSHFIMSRTDTGWKITSGL